jgi:hypothetical protein
MPRNPPGMAWSQPHLTVPLAAKVRMLTGKKRRAMNGGAPAKPQLLCNGANPSGAATDVFR